MNEQRPNLLMPALVGGGLAGILSAIPLVNCLCCLWIIGGAMLASYLLAKDSKVTLNAGDGAIIGAVAGLVATFTEAIVSIPFNAMSSELFTKFTEKLSDYSQDIPQGWEKFLQGGYESTWLWFFIGLLITAVIFIALGILGGVIGISLFSKKKPPQPQDNATP